MPCWGQKPLKKTEETLSHETPLHCLRLSSWDYWKFMIWFNLRFPIYFLGGHWHPHPQWCIFNQNKFAHHLLQLHDCNGSKRLQTAECDKWRTVSNTVTLSYEQHNTGLEVFVTVQITFSPPPQKNPLQTCKQARSAEVLHWRRSTRWRHYTDCS